MLTVISMYRADDAEFFVQVVDGRLTEEERATWRKKHNADQGDPDAEEQNNMFFREFERPFPAGSVATLWEADGEKERAIQN